MNGDRIANIFAGIIGVAMVTTIVAHPGTSNVVKAVGGSFSDSLRAAMGK